MLATPELSTSTMGAIDPMVTRGHPKIKSASIEASNQPGSRSARGPYGSIEEMQCSVEQDSLDNSYHSNQQQPRDDNDSFHLKAKKFLTLSPGSLKPSVSTSCLLTADNDSSSTSASNALICIPTRASLTHEWKKLKTPNKCRECNLLVYFNGRECSFCGFVAHKKCVTVLVIKCSGQHVAGMAKSKKDKQGQQHSFAGQSSCNAATEAAPQSSRTKIKPAAIKPIFGQPVSIDGRQVVDFMRRFIYEIDTRGLNSKGIYRVSSIKSKVDRLCNYYDQNLSSLVDLSSFHPNIIANALKMYLRQLPEPLLTHQLYNDFINMGKKYPNSSLPSLMPSNNKQQKPRRPYSLLSASSASASMEISINPYYNPMLIVELREIIDSLPPVNRELIAIIMRHLKRVANMSETNQMSAKNLSIIFGPTLLSDDNKSLAIVDNIHQARVVELMIIWADQIFPQYANYESKAVIELDVPEKQSNTEKQPKVDLRELRRQFFTVPKVETNLVTAGVASELRSTEANRAQLSKTTLLMRPYYCDTLTKL